MSISVIQYANDVSILLELRDVVVHVTYIDIQLKQQVEKHF